MDDEGFLHCFAQSDLFLENAKLQGVWCVAGTVEPALAYGADGVRGHGFKVFFSGMPGVYAP